MEPLIQLNKNVAETLFGSRAGRPTISARAGRHIGSALGITATAGKDLFHVGLAVASLVVIFGNKK